MKYVHLPAFALYFIGLLLTGCASDDPRQTDILDQAEIPKVDFHTHYFNERPYLESLLQDWNMRAIVIDLFREENPNRDSWQSARAVRDKHPDRILLCATFDASRIGEPDFAEATIAQLREDINDGAVMVKVWKNIGMVYKDEDGSYIQIDDPRLQPIWDFLEEQDIPVLAHIGEPRAAWRPLDEESPHYTYYKNNPEYHNYNSSEVPEWTTIIEARDNWLASNPNLTVIGAHLGSMAYDVDVIAKRFEKYPNFYVDTAERFGDLAIQDSEKVRQFFIDYQDRILYGTDLSSWEPTSELSDDELRDEERNARRRLDVHWQYLTGNEAMTFERTGSSFTAPTSGLDLPRQVVEKVYYQNAARLVEL